MLHEKGHITRIFEKWGARVPCSLPVPTSMDIISIGLFHSFLH